MRTRAHIEVRHYSRELVQEITGLAASAVTCRAVYYCAIVSLTVEIGFDVVFKLLTVNSLIDYCMC